MEVRQIRTRSRWHCEPQLDAEGCDKKDRVVKNYKVIMSDKADDFRNTIA